LETAERKDFHAFRVRFVGECVALVVAETPRKPTIEQVDVFTDIRATTRPHFYHFNKRADLTA
jgi:hypothetical protein